MAKKNGLSDEVKTFIVQQLACFDSPSVVADAVKHEFGLVVPRQQVETYEPGKRAAKNLGERWKALFEETRKTFLETSADIGISHRTVRLRALERMAKKAETQGNIKLASELLEQAAKEMGDAYTNRRELSGPGGRPIPTSIAVRFLGADSDRDGPGPAGGVPAAL